MSVIKKVFDFVVKNDKANKSIGDTKKNIDETTKKTQTLGKENKKVSKGYGDLRNAINNATFGALDGLNNLKKVGGQAFNAVASQGLKFGSLLNKVLPTGFKLSSIAAKGFALALAATGITIVTAAVAALIEYFSNFRSAAKLVEKATATIGVVMTTLVDTFKALLTLDFGSLVDVFSDFGDNVRNATDAVDDLFEAEDKLFNLRQRTIKENAKLKVEQQNLAKVVEDTTLSTEERIQASKDLEKVNQRLLKNQQDEIKLEKDKLKAKLATENNEDKQRELQIQINKLDAQSITLKGNIAEVERKSSKQRRRIREQDKKEKEQEIKEEEKKVQERIDLQNELNEETRKLRIENIDDEKQKLKAQYDLKLDNIRKKYGDGTELEKELIKKRDEELKDIDDKNEQKKRKKEKEAREKLRRLDLNDNEKQLQDLKDKKDKELEIIENAGLSPEAETEAKLQAEQRYANGLAEIEENKLAKLEQIKDKFLPDDQQGLSEKEKFELEREQKLEQLEIELEDLEIAEEEKAKIIQKFQEETTKKAKELKEQELEDNRIKTETDIKMSIEAAGAITDALSEGSEAAKGFAVAGALFNTYQGITEAIKAPTLPQRIAEIAFASATGFGAVKNILSTDSQTGAGPGANGGGVVTVPTQAPRFDTVGDSQRVRDTQAQSEQQPTEAFVVSGKVTNQQSLDRNKSKNSRFV